MKIGDKVWCTRTAQELLDMGFGNAERTFMLHAHGTVEEIYDCLLPSDSVVLVSYEEFCNFEEGYEPVKVYLKKDYWKVDNSVLEC